MIYDNIIKKYNFRKGNQIVDINNFTWENNNIIGNFMMSTKIIETKWISISILKIPT